jgi:hypothetical protein
MTSTVVNVRGIAILLLLAVVAVIYSVLATSSPVLSSKDKPGDGCVQVVHKVSNTPVVHTRICIPDVPIGQ